MSNTTKFAAGVQYVKDRNVEALVLTARKPTYNYSCPRARQDDPYPRGAPTPIVPNESPEAELAVKRSIRDHILRFGEVNQR